MRASLGLLFRSRLLMAGVVGLAMAFFAIGFANGAYAQDAGSIEEEELAEALGIIFVVLFFAVMIILLVLGLWQGLKADREWRHQANFYPVSLTKFLVMSFVTFGMYQILWFMKNWNWVKKQSGELISPAWRSVFGVLWLYALIQRINEFPREDSDRFSMRLGGVLAILYLLLSIWGNMGTFDEVDQPPWIIVIPFLAMLMPVPVVAHIIKLNVDNPEPVRKNSRFGPLAITGILLGGISLILILAEILGLIPEV